MHLNGHGINYCSILILKTSEFLMMSSVFARFLSISNLHKKLYHILFLILSGKNRLILLKYVIFFKKPQFINIFISKYNNYLIGMCSQWLDLMRADNLSKVSSTLDMYYQLSRYMLIFVEPNINSTC